MLFLKLELECLFAVAVVADFGAAVDLRLALSAAKRVSEVAEAERIVLARRALDVGFTVFSVDAVAVDDADELVEVAELVDEVVEPRELVDACERAGDGSRCRQAVPIVASVAPFNLIFNLMPPAPEGDV